MTALSAAHEGKYVFLVVRDGRSFPCTILKVEDVEVTVQETDHDEWPFSIRTAYVDDVAGVITVDEAEEMVSREADNFMRQDISTFFTYLRGALNGEDLLAHPRKAGEPLEIPGASFDEFVAEQQKKLSS